MGKIILKIIAYIIFLLVLAGLTFIITMWIRVFVSGRIYYVSMIN